MSKTFEVNAESVKEDGLMASALRLAALVRLSRFDETEHISANISCDIHDEMNRFANAIWDAWKEEYESQT